MKKVYMAPAVQITELSTEEMIAASGITSDGDGIGYGGMDEDGTMEAETRQLLNVFLFD